jgi:hypothetical protein
VFEPSNCGETVIPSLVFLLVFLPVSCFAARERLDQSEKHQAKPEIDDYPKVEARGIMASNGRKMRHEEEIHRISGHDGNKALQKIHSSLF